MVSHPELLVRRMVEEDAAKYSIAAFPSLYMVDKRGNIHLIAEYGHDVVLSYLLKQTYFARPIIQWQMNY